MSAPTVQTLEIIAGGVTTPRGFRAAGIHAGIKAKAGNEFRLGRKDNTESAG